MINNSNDNNKNDIIINHNCHNYEDRAAHREFALNFVK